MKNFLKRVLMINGVVDLCVGASLVLAPRKFSNLLGFSDLPDYASFFAGGWGVAVITFGLGRIMASWDQRKWRLWALLGLLEGGMLTFFCLRFWLGGGLVFLQVSVPLLTGAVFAICYAASYPSLNIVVRS